MNKKIDERDKVIVELSDRLDRSEQYARRNNLRITGIAESEGEDTDDLIIAMAKSIGIDVSHEDIDISHRLPKRLVAPQTPSRPILVRMVSNSTQRKLLKSRSRLKGPKDSKKPKIFINEDWTRPRATIAKKSRQLV